MMKKYILNLFVLSIAIILGSSVAVKAFTGNGSIVSGGITRTFTFHCPGASVGANLSMMLVFHGDGGTGSGIEGYTGFDVVADANNFLCVYPNAINGTWNRYADTIPGDGGLLDPTAPDDAKFIADLIDYFCVTYHINSNKVYASGFSAGGFVCYDLAVLLPNKIAAFAPVSGSLWGENTFLSNYFAFSYSPVPIYHIHGDADPEVMYPDTNHNPVAGEEWPLGAFSFGNCGNATYTSTANIVPGVNKLSFCNAAKEVYLIQIVGGLHAWPNVAGYNAATAIWNFCNTYALTTASVCSASINDFEAPLEFTISPNPSNGNISIHSNFKPFKTKFCDLLGNEIAISEVEENSFSINSKTSGVYFVMLYSAEGQVSIKKVIVK